jgi:hypothetical protein
MGLLHNDDTTVFFGPLRATLGHIQPLDRRGSTAFPNRRVSSIFEPPLTTFHPSPLGGLSVIAFAQSTQSLAAYDPAAPRGIHGGLGNGPIPQALMRPFMVVILLGILVNHVPQVPLAKQNHLVQAFHSYGLHKSLAVGIRLHRALHPMGVKGRDAFGLSIHFIPCANRKWSW